MRGPVPKDPALRQRRNKASTRATLTVAGSGRQRAPSLPRREDGWHKLTIDFWRDIWHSPMSKEYLPSDVHGLYRLAMLVDRFWRAPSVVLEAQILKSGAEYGLSALSRRRLEWIVERAQEAKKPPRYKVPSASDDPRKLFSVV